MLGLGKNDGGCMQTAAQTGLRGVHRCHLAFPAIMISSGTQLSACSLDVIRQFAAYRLLAAGCNFTSRAPWCLQHPAASDQLSSWCDGGAWTGVVPVNAETVCERRRDGWRADGPLPLARSVGASF